MSLSVGDFVSSFVDLSVHSVAHLLFDCLLVQLLDSSLVQNVIVSRRRSSISFMCLKDTPQHTQIVRSTVCDAESYVSDIVTLAPFC